MVLRFLQLTTITVKKYQMSLKKGLRNGQLLPGNGLNRRPN